MTPAELLAECRSFLRWYPGVWAVEEAYGLPRGLLLAEGAQESDLDFVKYGAGQEAPGGAFGVWQLQGPPVHSIPRPFPVAVQARTAASMLAGLLREFSGSVIDAACAYNAGPGAVEAALRRGENPNAVTTGGAYGDDVAEMRVYVAGWYPEPAHPKPKGPLAA